MTTTSVLTGALTMATTILVGVATSAPAQPRPATAPAPAPSDFSLTIYSTADPAGFDPQSIAQQEAQNPGGPPARLPGYGVVRETRRIDLAAGENVLKFTDVAAEIDPTTVSFKSLTAPDSTSVLEQSYEYDLVNPDKLLQKYLGKTIIINRKLAGADQRASSVETIQGELLSYDGNAFVLQTANKQLPVEIVPRSPDITEVKLFDLKTGLITKPTLVWKVSAERAGEHRAQVTYQTQNLTWRADYGVTVNADDTAADVSAWVSIVNASGASYPDAKLKLVAGDVQRVTPQQPEWRDSGGAIAAKAAPAAPAFTEKSFFEYHLYTLARTTSLANASTKQIELFPAKAGVPVAKTYVYYGLPAEMRYWTAPAPNQDRDLGTQANKKVDIYLQLKNTEKNGLGIPLPAGRVRAYKRDDADAAVEFIGEDVIQHTPKDEDVLVRLGSAFDLVGDRKQTDFNIDERAHTIVERFEIAVRNHKKSAAKVLIKENLYRWSNWEILNSTDKYEKQDARTIHIPVDVPADGEKKVTYSVKYTW